MKKYFKRILSFVLALAIVLTMISLPKASTDIKVTIQNTPKIDIMLTSKETNLDLTNFEADVKNKLEENGINTNDITFQTIERASVDTKQNDAKTIFDTWTAFPYNKKTNWKVLSDTNGTYLTSSDNETYETGFFDTTNGYVNNITMSSKVFCTQYNQPMGFIFRMTEDESDPNRYNYYCLSMTGYTGQNYSVPNAGSTTTGPSGLTTETPKRIFVLYKVEGMVFDYNIWKNTTQKGHTDQDVQYKTLGTWGATAWYCLKYKSQYVLGSASTNYRNAGGWRDGTPLQVGQTNVNLGDSKQKSTILGYSLQPLETSTGADWLDITITAKGTNIDISYDGKSIINVNDNSFTEGYYGVYQVTHVTPKYYETVVSTESIKTFKEVLTEPTWRDDAKHIVVNVDNNIDDTLTSTSTIGEILSRTLADDIHFIQWGTDTNKSATTNFIKQNDNKGLFTYNSDYEQAVEDTVDYIKKLIGQQQSSEDQYITIGQELNLLVTPKGFEKNAISDKYPNGRWKINHDYKYFANNLGQSAESGMYMSNLNCNFDKPGKYEITFDDEIVKTVYVHRKPVSDFEISIENLQITLNSVSYDLDSNEDNGYGKGIVSEKWYYKEVSESIWHEGKLEELDKENIYVIKLEVTDEQGISNYTTKYVGTGNPVSKFNFMNDTVCKYNKLEINNTSYDPEGRDIKSESWTLKKDGQVIGTYLEPILDFNTSDLGSGKYSYTLIVTNSADTISEAYTKTFTIVDDTVSPEIIVDTDVNNEWIPEKEMDIEVLDNESYVSKWRYEFVTSPTPTIEDDEWSAWDTEETEITVNTGALTGRYYLHVQAYDEANNLSERTVGPFNLDNTNPVINGVNVEKQGFRDNKVTIHAFDEHSGIVGYALTKYEPTTFDMRARTFAAVETPEFQESNEFKVESDGLYTAWAIDALGNIETSVCEVTNSNQTDKTTTVYAEIGSEFKVTIPKKIILSGTTKSGTYTVTVEGDIAGLEVISVTPDSAVTLSSKDKADVIGTITQDKLNWTYSEIYTDSKILANGSISAQGITAGAWNGTFNFAIKLENNGKYTNSIWDVEYQDITFDMEELDNSEATE